MAVIAPLRGLRYNAGKISKLEDVVTPPYDIIDEKAQQRLLNKNPYNMIQLDLSKSINVSVEDADRYERAKNTFEQWQAEQVLLRDPQPAIYLYYIDYTHPSGRRMTRKGLVTLVELADFSEGIVKPHERTFSKVTDDRLRLLETCKAQFSNVFSLYPDPECAVIGRLEQDKGDLLCSVVDSDGCRHSLWAVSRPEAIAEVQELFRTKALYIADGHHRYTTALRYRAMMGEQGGGLSADSPYNFIMMYLCGMEDPGLSVLATHRLVRLDAGMTADQLVAELSVGFTCEEMTGGSREILLAEVFAKMDENAENTTMLGLYHPVEDRCFALSLKPGVVDERIGKEVAPQLKQLDVVVLSELTLGRLLGMPPKRCEEEKRLDYFSDPDEALDVAVKEASSADRTPVLFLMNSTKVSQVREVADADMVMPHKSTYFYPKILTGMVMNKFVDGEAVQRP